MKIRLIVAVTLGIVLVMLFANLLARDKDGLRFVGYADEARWSKDGKSLYYVGERRDGSKLCRYDVRTGKTQVYDILRPCGFCDISPDETQIVASRKEGLSIINLANGREMLLYSVKTRTDTLSWGPDYITDVAWLPQDKILFVQTTPRKGKSYLSTPFIIDPHERVARQVKGVDAWGFYAAADGSGFLYEELKKCYHIYDPWNAIDRKLPRTRLGEGEDIVPLYLSSRLLVYRCDAPTPVYRMLDPRTMTARRIKLASYDTYRDGDISPDLTKQWFSDSLVWRQKPPAMLYLADVPKATINQLRRAEHRR